MDSDKYLLPGEIFAIQDELNSESFFFTSDEDINKKYKKGEIRIITEQARYPLDSITNLLGSKKYILDPEYQRRKRWDNGRKSRLIESFIMNVPIPPIFLYEIDYSLYEVRDGLQRLTSISDFYEGNFFLEGLEYWKELNGRTYEQLPEQVRKGIDRRYLSSIILLQETAKTDQEAEHLKKIVFERLNSGGEKLTRQETRNALINGKFNQLCIELSENRNFREMWKLSLEKDEFVNDDDYKTMADVELVLRFFAYRHIDKMRSSVDSFLDSYLKQANNYSEAVLEDLRNLFVNTIECIYLVLGESAFYLPRTNRQYKSPSKTVYDAMMQAFARNIEHSHIFIENGKEIKEKLYYDKKRIAAIRGDKVPLFDARYTNRGDVQKRVAYFHDFLQDYVSKV